MPQYARSLFVFRRDLRLQDNTALLAAVRDSQEVLPCFILDPRQINEHPYRSIHALQFMLESLEALRAELGQHGAKLFFFEGPAEDVLEQLFTTTKFQAVYFNRDYTPFSLKRDAYMERVCQNHGVACHAFDDALLTAPGSVRSATGPPYQVYTHFARAARSQDVPAPQPFTQANWFKGELDFEAPSDVLQRVLKERNSQLAVRGGRDDAMEQLQKLRKLSNYAEERNMPALSATTKLSAAHKFGVLSVRESYHAIVDALGQDHTLISELYWRDFFTHLAYNFPHVFEGAFDPKYRYLTWQNNETKFQAWCEGLTGFPIVDAGMRELNQTGFMHNRVRMIVASFLVKDLHIDWRWGERYFAQHLVDYDPAVNNGNWQWAASTGADAQPYFRIFNPWSQQKKFDPECEYIRHWVDELRSLDAAEIHTLEKSDLFRPHDYPAPIIDHRIESQIAKARYQQR